VAGKPAIRVEAQPNDDPLALGANSERAEMLIMQGADKALIKETHREGPNTMLQAITFR
jgi:hypothetical protein